jgi:hypothetical protein
VNEVGKTKKRKRIRYAEHLHLRLALRKIPQQLPRRIYQRAKERFFDTATRNFVAVTRARYAGKIREMAVSFAEDEEIVTLITIHPLHGHQKTNRIASGRWIPYETEKN